MLGAYDGKEVRRPVRDHAGRAMQDGNAPKYHLASDMSINFTLFTKIRHGRDSPCFVKHGTLLFGMPHSACLQASLSRQQKADSSRAPNHAQRRVDSSDGVRGSPTCKNTLFLRKLLHCARFDVPAGSVCHTVEARGRPLRSVSCRPIRREFECQSRPCVGPFSILPVRNWRARHLCSFTIATQIFYKGSYAGAATNMWRMVVRRT